MKKSIVVFLMLLPGSFLFSQVSVNSTGNPPDGSAMLDVSSNNSGMLFPRITSAAMASIANPAAGLMVFNLDLNKPVFFNGTGWTSFDGQYSCGGPFIDSRDGQSYPTVPIGTRCWMAENLNVGTRIDGTAEPSNDGTIEKYCYDDLPANCDTYGGLYQWDEVMQYTTTPGVQGICPAGWHVPTDDEWTASTNYVRSTPAFLCNSNTLYIAKALASTNLWNSSANTCAVGNNLAENNATGFSALAGGYRTTNGSFTTLGYYSYWWSSTEFESTYAKGRSLLNSYTDVILNNSLWTIGRSLRCMKD